MTYLKNKMKDFFAHFPNLIEYIPPMMYAFAASIGVSHDTVHYFIVLLFVS